MTKRDSRSEVRLTADADPEPERHDRCGVRPFVIQVLGDFRGGAGHDSPDSLASRRFIAIDRDNFDRVLARLEPRCEVRLGDTTAELSFRELDDFHPDRIARRLGPLKTLIDTRRALNDPSRFEAAAAEVAKWAKGAAAAPAPEQKPSTASPQKSIPTAGLLDRILDEEPTAEMMVNAPGASDLQRFVERIVAPHLIRIDTTRQAELIGAVDQALGEQLRAILHAPTLQHLEAAWRSLWLLVSGVESDVALKIRILQCTKEELQEDLSRDDIRAAAAVRLLLDAASVPGSDRPALLIGNYEFDHGADDVQLLGCLGAIAEQLGAPFVAAASPQLLGCASFTELPDSVTALASRFQRAEYEMWRGLRSLPQARWLALTLPRVLCRLPYGAKTEAVETFEFEECTGTCHEDLLWGNGAFTLAAVAAGAFASVGWSLDLSRGVQRLEGLPLYIYRDAGAAVTKPCAEVLVTERLLAELEATGLLPLVSYRDSDSVVLPCLQSLAEPRSPLKVGGS